VVAAAACLTLPALLLAGLILRLWQINGAFWYDEAFSARLAQMPPENILTATFFDVHPPAYYLLLWFVGQWAGYSEWVLRLPSVAAGVLLIWLVYRLGLSLGLAPPVVLLAAEADGRVSLALGVTKDLTGRFPAGTLIREVVEIVGGKGGGRPDMAQAGGNQPENLDAALKSVAGWVESL